MSAAYSPISRLPPEMLVKIFVCLPVKCLVKNVPLVSHSWYRLAQIARSEMHSLTVLVGDCALEHVRWSIRDENMSYIDNTTDPDMSAIEAYLHRIDTKGIVMMDHTPNIKLYPPLSMAQSEWLMAHFSHITHLELIELYLTADAMGIHSLLDQLCTQLQGLKLFIEYIYTEKDNNPQLSCLINSLTTERFPRLRRLSLTTTEPFNKRQLTLPMLAQLDTFSLIAPFNKIDILAGSLCKYAGPNNLILRSIKLDHADFSIEGFIRALKGIGRADENTLKAIGGRFHHLAHRDDKMFTKESARLLVKYFTNLAFLSFIPNHARRPIENIFGPLAQLTHLETLKIELYIGDEVDSLPTAHTNSLKPLLSVRKLIQCNDSYDGYLPRHSIAEEQLRPNILLPKLETVHCVEEKSFWLFPKCYQCGYHDSETMYWIYKKKEYFTETRMACLAALLAPFESCVQLRNKAFLVKKEHPFRVPGWQCEVSLYF